MKISICTLLFCLLCNLLPAQTKPVTLNGTIAMNTGETFPYKIVITETDGVVKGYSITYTAPDDVKTLIQGTLDRRNHTLIFKETEIVYSHNVHTKAYMCLVDAKLTYDISRENALKGPITSKQTDNTSCTGGTLKFSNSDEIQFLFAYHNKYDTVINMKKKVVMEAAPEPAKPQAISEPPMTTDKVTAGIEKTYDWYTDTVIIDVWDGGNTDGDRITLQFNGKPVLTNYYLVKEKKQLRIPLAFGVNTVTIIADNEGSDPPNTASMLFTDGSTRYNVLAYNVRGQQAIIKIKKVTRY